MVDQGINQQHRQVYNTDEVKLMWLDVEDLTAETSV